METPYYLYNRKILQQTLDTAIQASSKFNFLVYYALKANSNSKIIKIVSDCGFGAACASTSEIDSAMEYDIPCDKIIFSSQKKTEEDIFLAIDANVFQINVESWTELEIIDKISLELGKITNIALTISPEIKTNKDSLAASVSGQKCSFYIEDIPSIIQSISTFKNVKLSGLHFYIGSQISDMETFKDFAIKVGNINKLFLDRNLNITNINLQGGLDVNYLKPEEIPDFEQFFSLFNDYLYKKEKQKIHFELGRSLVANSGSLITKVLSIETNNLKKTISIDATVKDFNKNIKRNNKHLIKNISTFEKELENYDISGPKFETFDTFCESVEINISRPGDILKIFSVGAYTKALTQNYKLTENSNFILI